MNIHINCPDCGKLLHRFHGNSEWDGFKCTNYRCPLYCRPGNYIRVRERQQPTVRVELKGINIIRSEKFEQI
jgi:hypothetical protein